MDRKYLDWESRHLKTGLQNTLEYSFMVKRVKDDDDVYFTVIPDTQPLRLCHIMEAEVIAGQDDFYGIILNVRGEKMVGSISRKGVEAGSKEDKN